MRDELLDYWSPFMNTLVCVCVCVYVCVWTYCCCRCIDGINPGRETPFSSNTLQAYVQREREREREKAIEGGHIIVRSNTYLPPVRVILIDYLQYVSFLEGNAQAFTGNLIVTMTIIVEMSTHIFLDQ